MVDFSEVRFVVAVKINTAGSENLIMALSYLCWGLSKVEADRTVVFWQGLWRCLAFFTAVVKVLHSIHCEVPPQISPQKSKHVGWNYLFMQSKVSQSG